MNQITLRERAIDNLQHDFLTTREWVHDQIENNRASFAHSIAEIMLSEDEGQTTLVDIQRMLRDMWITQQERPIAVEIERLKLEYN